MKKFKIAIIGLGYVGLPLALAFGKKYEVIGFDLNLERINELRHGVDRTNEVPETELDLLKNSQFTNNLSDISECNVYIVTVPTPVTKENIPDLGALIAASKMIGEILAVGDTVVYESTVYPGATEEVCIPELEKHSGLSFNNDFSVGYSPERINPGDAENRLEKIVKVVSGSNSDALNTLADLYGSIITAGIYKAKSIKVAEAAKVIENTQRDINIALMNDLSNLFFKLGINTQDVLSAASTKWNFLSFTPGLVGGHCIGVDPYYLTYKAQSVGHNPDFIISGRRINEGVAGDIADRTILEMAKRKLISSSSKVLILGCTFKENCPDIRNSKVFDLIDRLTSVNMEVHVWDPYIGSTDWSSNNYKILDTMPDKSSYSAILLTVAHAEFKRLGSKNIRRLGLPSHVFFDVKSAFPSSESDFSL